MKRWKLASLFCLGSVLLLAGFVAFALPGILKSRAVQRVESATGRKLAIGGISINPFTLTVTVRDLRLSEPGGGEGFATLSSARVSLSPASLYRRAPVIAAARLSAPHLRIVRVGANRYNFSDLLKFLPLHPRLSVNNLTVNNGCIDLVDRGLPSEKRHELRSIELAVPFITTMPYYAERYIAPRLSAVVNGSPFHLVGRLRPFPRAVEARVNVEFEDASLPYYLSYLPTPLPVRVASGSISTKLTLDYRAPQQAPRELAISGQLALANVKVADRSGTPLLTLTRLDAGIVRARLPAGDCDLSLLSADGLELFLKRDKEGVWSPSRLLSAAAPGSAPPRGARISVQQTRLSNGRLHISDALPPGGFSRDLAGVSLDLRGFSTAPGKRADYALSFSTSRGEQAELKGAFSPSPLASASKFKLSGITLEDYYPYFPWAERFEAQGKFTVAGELDCDPQRGLRLDQVSARGRPFGTSVGGKARLARSALSLSGLTFSRKENLLEVAEARLSEGEVRFSRLRTGGQRPLAAGAAGAAAGRGGGAARSQGPRLLSYRIGHLSGTAMQAVFTDEMPAARPSFTLEKVAFSLEGLAGPQFGPTPFRAVGAYGKSGLLSATGSLVPSPWSIKGELALQRMPLADFGPYLPERVNKIVMGGRVDARLSGALASVGHRLTGRYGGSAEVSALSCRDAEGAELLKVDKLQMRDIKGSLEPSALYIGAVALTRFRSRIVIAPNGSLNFQQLSTRGPQGKEPRPAAKAHAVRLGQVTLQDGTLAFADHHVAGGYTTTLFNLGGRISELSTGEDRLADLDLHGNLENRSPLRITGVINPLRHDLFADLKVNFTGIELPPMTPYSGTYLGYAVDKGKLFLESRYRIENRKIDAQNHVLIDQLDLGKNIPSDRATALPVRLAVALLKDRKGEIRLDIPVLGQTDDPQFSVWRVALKVLKNLVVKAAGSPFALLQSMCGAKEDLSSVGFAPGSAALSPRRAGKAPEAGGRAKRQAGA